MYSVRYSFSVHWKPRPKFWVRTKYIYTIRSLSTLAAFAEKIRWMISTCRCTQYVGPNVLEKKNP